MFWSRLAALFWQTGTFPFRLMKRLYFFLFVREGSRIYGSAEYLSEPKQNKLLRTEHKGLVIDGKRSLSLDYSFQHAIVLAPSGMGKTTRYILPNAFYLPRHGSSAVFTDPSGEIYEKTAGYLAASGYEIKVLDARRGFDSLQFNPLYRAGDYHELSEMAEIILDTGVGEQSFWSQYAGQILTLFFEALKAKGQEINLKQILRLLHLMGTKEEEKVLRIFASDAVDKSVKEAFLSFCAKDEKVISGVTATALVALGKMADPDFARLSEQETLHFETLRQKKTVLYLIFPEEKVSYYRFFFDAFVLSTFSFLYANAY